MKHESTYQRLDQQQGSKNVQNEPVPNDAFYRLMNSRGFKQTMDGKRMRDVLCQFLNHEGAVDWQNKMI